MNAVVKPKWQRLKTTLLEDVKHGAPLEMLILEPDECVTWIDEEASERENVSYQLIDAVADMWARDEKKMQRFDALTRKLMLGTMTADELCEWRDIQRAALIDHCSSWARGSIGEELPL